MSNEILQQMGKPKVGKWIAAGFVVIVVFLGTFGAWAGLVPIDAATVAQGTIEVKNKRKTIQHLEGGIVREILIKEHSPVTKGQLLVKLDITRAQAALDLINNQYLSALAQEARLLAEQHKQASISWPEALTPEDPLALKAMIEQQGIFQKRITTHAGKMELLDNKTQKTRKALGGIKKQLSSLQKQYQLISKEVENTRVLAKKGLVTQQRLMGLEREQLGIDERLRSLETRINAGQYEIDDSQLQISNLENTYNNEIAESLQQARLNVSNLLQKHKAAKDVLSRAEILAPNDGIIINLAVTTLGSVIGPGETIMEIVPSGATYTVETRINPTDIDDVEIGAKTRIRLTAYKQRITPTLEGLVEHISADALFDDITGDQYYNAIITISPESLQKYSKLRLYPGMPADVMIISESRTVVEYLFQPVFESFSHAFREN